MTSIRILVLMLAIFAVPLISSAAGMDITPFRVTNQSPLIQIYGIPAESASIITPTGKHSATISVDSASSSTVNRTVRERISLDGETTRITTSVRYGFGKRFEAGVTIPVVNQGGGFLDQFIINWHNAFSLPQGERTSTTKNRLAFTYQKNNVQKLNMTRSDTSVGDISFFGGMQLLDTTSETSRSSIALRGDLKLPTGDSGMLAGSGSADLALSATASHNRYGAWGTTGVFGSFGMLGMTRGEVLSDQQNRFALFGTLGAGWSPASWISVKVQLNGHSPMYHGSDLTELRSSSLMLTTGGSLKLGKSYLLDIGVSEDIAVATSPDVAFHIALRREF